MTLLVISGDCLCCGMFPSIISPLAAFLFYFFFKPLKPGIFFFSLLSLGHRENLEVGAFTISGSVPRFFWHHIFNSGSLFFPFFFFCFNPNVLPCNCLARLLYAKIFLNFYYLCFSSSPVLGEISRGKSIWHGWDYAGNIHLFKGVLQSPAKH